MAVIKKDGSSMGLPMNITRGNPIPIDSTSVWYSLQEAQNYATNSPVAYVGQLISVVNENDNTADVYIIINEAGNLLYLSPRLIEEAAQRASQSAIVAGNYAAQAIQAQQAIEQKIWYGTMAEYNALETVNNSTIYIILHE